MPKPDWTAEKLERSLRRWVRARHLTISPRKFRPDDCSAMAHYNEDARRRRIVEWDRDQIGRLSGTIHELVEIHLGAELIARWGDLKEAVVVALENAIVLQIEGNPERLKWWRKAMDEREAS